MVTSRPPVEMRPLVGDSALRHTPSVVRFAAAARRARDGGPHAHGRYSNAGALRPQRRASAALAPMAISVIRLFKDDGGHGWSFGGS